MTPKMRMNIIELETRLLTDRSLRELLRRSAESVIRMFDLSEEDAELVRNIDVDQLDRQADCLIMKRACEVRKLMPVTAGRIGESFGALFAEYAPKFWPEGPLRHWMDADHFARSLSDRKDGNLAYAPEIHFVNFMSSKYPIRLHWVTGLAGGRRCLFGFQLLLRRRGNIRQTFVYFG